jgi:lipid A 3-O-deacylase
LLRILPSFFFLILFSFAARAERSQFIFDVGNDYFTGPSHTDRYLTNNITIGFVEEGLPVFLENMSPLFGHTAIPVRSWSISQEIYTPENTELKNPDPQDQPYGGWLFVAGSLGYRQDQDLFLYEVQLGMVGPAALAEQAQNFYHDLIGVGLAQGWDYQLHDEFGVNVGFTYAHSLMRVVPEQWGYDFIYGLGGFLGNVHTYGELATVFRFGYNIPDDLGYRAGVPQDSSWSFYGFLRGQGRVVARDIFLDGNTDGNSRSVEKRILVALGSAGLSLGFYGFDFAYSYEVGTKRFKTQTSTEARGSFAFTYSQSF